VNGGVPTAFADGVWLDEAPVRFLGMRLHATMTVIRLADGSPLYHPSFRTLVVADLVHNIGRPNHLWTKTYTKVMGFYDRVALSRAIRGTAFPDRAAARRSIDALLALPFERLVVGHGAPLTTRAKEALAAAYAWLGTR
jgi:hypothetical protein